MDQVIVIRFGKQSYVYANDYSNRDRLIVNGQRDWPKARGDERWLVVPGAVKSVARYNAPAVVTTKYRLREDLVCAAKPTWVSPQEHDALPTEDRLLYKPVTETRDTPATSLLPIFIDGNNEPRKIPHGIKPKAPHHVDMYEWFWWTLPCEASRDFVFQSLVERVKALDPAQFAVTVYSNIKHLRVESHEVNIGGVAYRPATSLVSIDRDTTVPILEGANLDDLLDNVRHWCDEKLLAVQTIMHVKNCPLCGHKLGKRVLVRGREAHRRTSHDIS